MTAAPYKKEILVEDERHRGFPAVVKYGPYLLLSGSDGHRDLTTEKINPALDNKPTEQCRNAYGRVARRLEKAGYGGEAAVWIENFTSGQTWRLERMALWPEFFGEEEHGNVVSFGSQTKMNGLNMLTANVMAMVPEVPRVVGVKQPHKGRASRVTRCGDLVFVIGVRGKAHPVTKIDSPEEEDDGAFDTQLDNCFETIKSHLSKLDTPMGNLVRVDGSLRSVNNASRYREIAKRHFSGKLPFAGLSIGTILGGRIEQEVGGIAAAPGVMKEIAWSKRDPDRAEAATAGGLVFTSGCSGLLDGMHGEIRRDLYGDLQGQVKQAITTLEAALGRLGSGLDRALRLDIFLRDIYSDEAVIRTLKEILGRDMPALTIIGADPEYGADIELVAIAGR